MWVAPGAPPKNINLVWITQILKLLHALDDLFGGFECSCFKNIKDQDPPWGQDYLGGL